MSMLARYRKQGGVLELVKLIEDSAEPKRSALLKMIRTEDPMFAVDVESRIYNFERIKQLPESTIAEIVGAVPAKFVATALYGDSPEFTKLCEKCLGKAFNDYKLEKENFEATPPSSAQVETARRKFVSEARKLESTGVIKLPAAEGGAAVAPGAASSGAGAGAGAGSSVSGAALGGASAAPSIASFGMQPPPAGLKGADLEAFFKKNLS